ncbi:MAG: insulinase family protein [Planctomycetes bacterium]|nr:insulinase family protein [Planctomycetota bacterium]
MTEITSQRLACGATLVVEPVPNVASAALSWLLPVGSAGDADERDGMAAMLSEMIFRGAGELSSRDHSDALDRLGVQRSSGTRSRHLQISALLVGDRLTEALPLLTAMIREPSLPGAAVDPVRSLCLQSLEALEDDPQQLVMLRLREQHLPPPLGRHGYGDATALEAVTGDDLRQAWAARCAPGGSILAAAGDIDAGGLARSLDELLDGWSGEHREVPVTGVAPRGYRHIERDTQQVHVGLAFDAPPESDTDAMLERLAIAVLSGSTSGRLFTEVRQKRSLCYSVGASYRASRDFGLVALYAGTTPERAQETLDVCTAEIDRLLGNATVTAEEFARAVIGLKSHLVMQGESTPARAAAVVEDTDRLGRARSLEEVAAQVDAITLDELNAYCANRAAGALTIVSIGKQPLEPRERPVSGSEPVGA